MSSERFTVNIAGREVSFSAGEVAKQANGAVIVQTGGTVIMVTACMSDTPREGIDFFPLLVDYQEKTYAAGRIPGGFFKREGRPKELEILSARVIDRSIRPLFPESLRNDVQVVCIVLSSDAENDPDILAVNGASFSLFTSDIPFTIPIGCCRVVKSGGEFIINPTYKQRQQASLEMVISGTEEKVMMIEAKADRESEETAVEAIEYAHKYIKEFIKLQRQAAEKIGKPKKQIQPEEILPEVVEQVESLLKGRLEDLYNYSSKEEFSRKKDAIANIIKEEFPDGDKLTQALEVFGKKEKEFIRHKILNTQTRPDGRAVEEIRNISCKAGVLPRTHGSALFTRGQTQSLAVTTLGTSHDMQMVEDLEGERFKRFMLHYSFPPFSVGEVSPLRSPSRREIGHGALAEKSLECVIPGKDKFPYTIRVVSEILESNGSSSMATVCASTLSLMDAGVPIEEPVAGIALGLISEGDRYIILTDIAGVEDHYGDMDFKVAGTKNGITAIQMDLKIDGVGFDFLREALARARKARLQILEHMNAVLPEPRGKISAFAPKILSIKISLDKIGELIGPGGRNIKKIIRETGASIDIDDETGTVVISSFDENALRQAEKEIRAIIEDLQLGKTYEATVKKITNFGAFCDVAPGKGGLLHISEISSDFVKDVSDYLKEGDVIKVKVIAIDEQGRVTFSKKQVDEGNNK